MRYKLLFLLLSALAVCHSAAGQSYGAPYSDIECLNVELDGSLTLRVTGEGRNRIDARQQARKNAVYNVIFKGVKTQDANAVISRPLIYEVNAAEKYASFMNAFFADGGDYARFVTMEDRRFGTNHKVKGGRQVGWAITVRVLRPELESYLKEQGIIKN